MTTMQRLLTLLPLMAACGPCKESTGSCLSRADAGSAAHEQTQSMMLIQRKAFPSRSSARLNMLHEKAHTAATREDFTRFARELTSAEADHVLRDLQSAPSLLQLGAVPVAAVQAALQAAPASQNMPAAASQDATQAAPSSQEMPAVAVSPAGAAAPDASPGGPAGSNAQAGPVGGNAAPNSIAPFGKEDVSRELQRRAATTQDTLVDAVENAEVAEIKRAVFRALTRLRAAEIKEFDTIARLETQALDEYNDQHQYRKENPLEHLSAAEPAVKTDKYTSFHN